jgi:glycogenin glucosyltransferase
MLFHQTLTSPMSGIRHLLDRTIPEPPRRIRVGFLSLRPRRLFPLLCCKQGHYRNVTGENHDITPSPDRNKVRKIIFPWEENPRPLPGRVFPDSDAPSPSLFLSPASQSQTSTTNPSTPEMRGPTGPSRISPLSPLRSLSSSLNFVNAWDNDPAIQKYATRLVKPPQLPIPLAPALMRKFIGKGGERVERSGPR